MILSEDGRWGTAYGRVCACSENFTLPVGQWKQIALACDTGDANTVADIFSLAAGDYDSRWVVYERDETNQVYTKLALTDTLEEGQGYWVITLDAGTATAEGATNLQLDVPLIADAVNGRQNLVGYPFTATMDWADIRIIDGASVLTLDQADPGGVCQTISPGPTCIMSRIANKYNGAAYEPFDGQTPGAEGTLEAFDGIWVKAFKAGIQLRFPSATIASAAAVSAPLGGVISPISPAPEKPVSHLARWHMRLSVESGELLDDGNVLGQLPDSSDGYDSHDLKELPPFGEPFLTIVFPHDDWGDYSGDYATDFHALSKNPQGTWYFHVQTSEVGKQATLRWDGPRMILRKARLWDEQTGKQIRLSANGSYTFTMHDTVHAFRLELGSGNGGRATNTTGQ